MYSCTLHLFILTWLHESLSLDDFGVIADLPDTTTRILRIPAPLLCYFNLGLVLRLSWSGWQDYRTVVIGKLSSGTIQCRFVAIRNRNQEWLREIGHPDK